MERLLPQPRDEMPAAGREIAPKGIGYPRLPPIRTGSLTLCLPTRATVRPMASGGDFGKAIGAVLGGAVLAGLAAGGLTAGRGPPAAVGAHAAPLTASFCLCHTGGGTNCVVDGDTFWIGGEKVRIADIDAPETHPPRCDHEAELGDRATLRLQQLLNAGPVTLAAADRDTDRYGRLLRIVERNGRSLGEQLVDEGLARRWTGRRLPWCDAA